MIDVGSSRRGVNWRWATRGGAAARAHAGGRAAYHDQEQRCRNSGEAHSHVSPVVALLWAHAVNSFEPCMYAGLLRAIDKATGRVDYGETDGVRNPNHGGIALRAISSAIQWTFVQNSAAAQSPHGAKSSSAARPMLHAAGMNAPSSSFALESVSTASSPALAAACYRRRRPARLVTCTSEVSMGHQCVAVLQRGLPGRPRR